MKASELMLGDWVKHASIGVTRVTLLDYYCSTMKPQRGVGLMHRDAEGNTFIASPFDIAICGIPLTSEILMKNGFIRRESVALGWVYTYLWFDEQDDKELENEHYFNLSPDPYEWAGFHWIPEMSAVSALCIKYVHELQHAMRLCGIKKEIVL